MWHKTSIPIVEHCTILPRIKAYHESYREYAKTYIYEKKDVICYKTKLLKFENKRKDLFDIATCKCKLFENC